jgi:hypothetical protein
MVRVPNVIGLQESRGMADVYAARLCAQPVWAETIGGRSSYDMIIGLWPPAGTRVPEWSTVEVRVGPARQGADIFVSHCWVGTPPND